MQDLARSAPEDDLVRGIGQRAQRLAFGLEAIGEIFNMFNAKNPDGFHPISGQNRRIVGGAVNPQFLQPTAYAGDFQQGEQRVGQVGFRFTF